MMFFWMIVLPGRMGFGKWDDDKGGDYADEAARTKLAMMIRISTTPARVRTWIDKRTNEGRNSREARWGAARHKPRLFPKHMDVMGVA